MKDINLFFAVDDNYCPFLSTTFYSILKNASNNYNYNFYVLHNGLSEESKNKVSVEVENQQSIKNVNLQFVDVTEKLEVLAEKLFTRDYYY